MASINMCDRCGAIGLEMAVGTLVFHVSPHSGTVKKELCPTCIGELVEWAETTPEREHSRAPFREPWSRPTPELETGE